MYRYMYVHVQYVCMYILYVYMYVGTCTCMYMYVHVCVEIVLLLFDKVYMYDMSCYDSPMRLNVGVCSPELNRVAVTPCHLDFYSGKF